MPHISIRPGDSLTIGEDITIQFEKFFDGCSHLDIYDAYHEISVVRGPAVQEPVLEPVEEDIQTHLRKLSKEIKDGLSKLESTERNELLSVLVRELYYSAADQERREKNRRRQAEGIAAAKARGTRFGAAQKPLPDNFEECRQQWRDRKITMREAALACGMSKTTFREAVIRKERSANCTV